MAEIAQETQQREYKRFSGEQRFEHIILLITFTGLALTGLPQRYAEHGWAQVMIDAMGGIESIRIVHRVLATLLMAEAIFHGGVLAYRIFVLGRKATMIPGLRDVRDVIQWVLFNLGLRREHPHLPRYNFGEKVEYLAVVWGTIVMIITGFIMWNPIASAEIMPGQFIPAARAAHSAEAVLAVLSILIWHMWNVHIRRFNKSMFTGRLSREAMEEEHGAELEALDRGEEPLRVPQPILIRRLMVFIPFAIATSVILTAILVYAISFEDTAITTLPERQTEISTDIDVSEGIVPTGAVVWEVQECDRCHGAQADGGEDPLGVSLLALGEEDELDFEGFVIGTRVGPADMPAYPSSRLSDEDMAHLWVWFESIR